VLVISTYGGYLIDTRGVVFPDYIAWLYLLVGTLIWTRYLVWLFVDDMDHQVANVWRSSIEVYAIHPPPPRADVCILTQSWHCVLRWMYNVGGYCVGSLTVELTQ
jgi:hypothetical protein